MPKITKNVIEECVSFLKIKGCNFTLYVEGSIYAIIDNKKVIFEGSAREAYYFLTGINYGISKDLKVSEKIEDNKDSSEYTALEYFKDREGKKVIIEAKKEAADTYFSQCKIKYTISIDKLKGNTLYFVAKIQSIAPSGIPYTTTADVGLRSIKIPDNIEIDKAIENLLKRIDRYAVDIVRDDNRKSSHLGPNYILWIDECVLSYLGWSNLSMLTKNVEFKIIS